MDKVKEAFTKHDRVVEDFVEGARLDVGLEAMCALEEDEERTLRELVLAVLDEARDCVIPRSFTAEDADEWDDEVLRTFIKELADGQG